MKLDKKFDCMETESVSAVCG